MIKGAPWSFAVCLAVMCPIIWSVTNWYYSGSISAKDATIENLKTALENKGVGGIEDLPTIDPKIKGKLWNNGGVICLSDG